MPRLQRLAGARPRRPSARRTGVLLREPLKPTLPALAQETTSPSMSVMVMMVLLKRRLHVGHPVRADLAVRLLRLLDRCVSHSIPPRRLLLAASGFGEPCGLHRRPPRSSSAPCGCARWSSSADRAPAGRGGDAGRGSADVHQALDVHRRSRCAARPRPCSRSRCWLRSLPVSSSVRFLTRMSPDDAGRLQDLARGRPTDAVDVGQRDLDPLVVRQINSCNTCQRIALLRLLLTLLVPRIALADHPDHAFATDHLAVLADLLDRRTDLHRQASGRLPCSGCPRADPRRARVPPTCSGRRSGRGTGRTATARP